MKPQLVVCAASALSLSLTACAMFTEPVTGSGSQAASRSAASAPAPAPYRAPPPPAPVYVPVAQPYPVPPPPAAPPTTTLQPGDAHAGQPTILRSRPQAQATAEHYIPAGATVRLQMRQTNSDGAWWFVEYQGTTGWLSESGLSP